MISKEQELRILGRLRNACARREYAVSDVRSKALAAVEKAMQTPPRATKCEEQPGNASATVERIVGSLISDGFVSDVRYAAAYAREKASIAGWGTAKIRYMLASKGISADGIASALSEIDRSAADARLRKTLAVKYAALRDDPRCRLKLLRFLTGRGYSYDEAVRAISQLPKE